MSRKPVGYLVIRDEQLGTLEQRVEDAMRKGWQPVGGVSAFVSAVSGRVNYLQAIILPQ